MSQPETNVRIQYINNDQPSSLTVKRTLFNLLENKFGSSKAAKRFCRESALSAIERNVPRGRISDSVFESALREVADSKFTQSES